MLNEIIDIFLFYLSAQFISILAFPLSFYVFKGFRDRGYFLSKTVGLLSLGYIYLIFLFYGLLRWDFFSNALLLLAMIFIFGAFVYFQKSSLIAFIKRNKRLILFGEALFLSCFILATFIKMGDPDIFSAEKYPDFNLFNRFLTEFRFPPPDNWLSGASINYYYMGHLTFAAITRLSGISPQYGFNLCIIHVFCLIFITSYSLAFQISEKKWIGIASAFFVSFLGNLDGLIQIYDWGIGRFDIWQSIYSVMENTVIEFPFYSFLLGDLHSHYSSLPFFLLLLSLMYSIWAKQKDTTESEKESLLHTFITTIMISILMGFILGANPWFFPVSVFLVYMIFLGKSLKNGISLPMGAIKSLFKTAIHTTLAVAFFLPLILSYESSQIGLRFLPSIYESITYQFILVWGFPLITIFIFSAVSLLNNSRKQSLILILVSLVPAFFLGLFRSNLPTFILAALLIYLAGIYLIKYRHSFILIIIISATTILLGCELIHVKDAYINRWFRYNTVFKFYFAVFAMIYLAIPVLFQEILLILRNRFARASVISIFCFFFLSSLIYAPLATILKNFSCPAGSKQSKLTLDGLRFMRHDHPGDYAAILWIRDNTAPDSIICEAAGSTHDNYARFSTFTGRSLIIGSPYHQRIYRNNSYRRTKEREMDIEKIYAEKDKKEILPLLAKYRVEYVIVGELERADYSEASLEAFNQVLQKVYSKAGVDIYKVGE